jgi:hypothetical protein
VGVEVERAGRRCAGEVSSRRPNRKWLSRNHVCRFLPVIWQLRFVGKVLECDWVGADHDTYDLIRSLLIEAMLVVEFQRLLVISVAPIAQEPTSGRFDKNTMRKRRAYFKQIYDSEVVGGVLLSPDNGYVEFAYLCVPKTLSGLMM